MVLLILSKHDKLAWIFLWVVCLLVASAASFARVGSNEIVLVEGTPIKLIINGEITSNEAKQNDPVNFTVIENVVIGGHVVVRTGTHATGKILKTDQSGYLGKSGKLAIQIDSTQTVDGKLLKLRAVQPRTNAADAAIASSLLSPQLLFTQSEAKIAAGTPVTVYVAEEKRFRVEGTTLVAVIANPAADATVYIYRPKNIVGSALEPSVFVDDIELARMDNGRYLAFRMKPGKHIVRMTDDSKGYALDIEPGKTYYFRIGIEAGVWKGKGNLTIDEADRAKAEIRKLKFLSADKIKATNLIVDTTPQ